MQEILVPSMVGALLAISWYWLMDLLPPFRAARRAATVVTQTTAEAPSPDTPPVAPTSVPPQLPADPMIEPEVRHSEAGAGIGLMVAKVVIAAAMAKRQQAGRIAVLQTGRARADLPALQQAVGASHELVVVSIDEAVRNRNRYDLLFSVGDQPEAVSGSIRQAYDMTLNLNLEELGENIRISVGTPKA